MTRPLRRPRLLTIAGSDSGGGAGIQADLKTFAAFGGYGMSALTGITAQNTREVRAVVILPPAMVSAQIAAVAEDIGVDAAKTGMLGSAAIVRAVARAIRAHAIRPLVVDPVMVAKSGDRLLAPDAIESLKRRLLPLATLVTPNMAEAAVLAGSPVRNERDMARAGYRIAVASGAAVLVKGGHLRGAPVDVLIGPGGLARFIGRRLPRRSTHGTGCTLAAAIVALLALGRPLEDAIAEAKSYLEGAMQAAPRLGGGASPPDHLWRGLPAAGPGRVRARTERRRRQSVLPRSDP